jgi:cephalosporin-C deacetylase-like acetyl esterase
VLPLAFAAAAAAQTPAAAPRAPAPAPAAPPRSTPTFTPDRADGIYAAGERVGWTVALPAGVRAAGAYPYTVRRNGGEVVAAGTVALRGGRGRIETSLAEPAMLVVEVRPPAPDSTFGDPSTGGPGLVRLGAAVAPTGIRAAEPKPADFDAFWDGKLRALDSVPMEPVVRPGESGRAGVEWATVRLNSVNGARVYGQLARPAGGGKFPALLIYQWASPPYPLQKGWVTDRAAEGWLALNVQPHDVPADMPQAFYDALPAMIKRYNTIGQHSRDESYFLQMYLGAYRASQYLAARPDWDGRTLVVMGTSMGGQQSFAVAGLNPRVTALLANVPAGADVTAALHGRWASYPNWDVRRPEVREAARYFDAANFGPRITARSLVAMGFIDDVSAPAGSGRCSTGSAGPRRPSRCRTRRTTTRPRRRSSGRGRSGRRRGWRRSCGGRSRGRRGVRRGAGRPGRRRPRSRSRSRTCRRRAGSAPAPADARVAPGRPPRHRTAAPAGGRLRPPAGGGRCPARTRGPGRRPPAARAGAAPHPR